MVVLALTKNPAMESSLPAGFSTKNMSLIVGGMNETGARIKVLLTGSKPNFSTFGLLIHFYFLGVWASKSKGSMETCTSPPLSPRASSCSVLLIVVIMHYSVLQGGGGGVQGAPNPEP